MVTEPEDYLSKAYEADLAVHGKPCICGHTTYMFPYDGRAETMSDWQAFALVQYEMNLLEQAFYAYGLSKRIDSADQGWPGFCTTRCPSQSRLIHPVRVLSHFERLMIEARHPKAKRFERDDILRYDAYFRQRAHAQLGDEEFSRLLEGIRCDPDCDVYRSAALYLRRHGFERVWQNSARRRGRPHGAQQVGKADTA